MGTRNLIAVMMDGEYKIAQYGQWDGYPDGQGVGVLKYLLEFCADDFIHLRRALQEVRFISDEELRQKWINAGADPDSEFVTLDISEKFMELYPELSRDTGSDILSLVTKYEKRELYNKINYISTNSLPCRYTGKIPSAKLYMSVLFASTGCKHYFSYTMEDIVYSDSQLNTRQSHFFVFLSFSRFTTAVWVNFTPFSSAVAVSRKKSLVTAIRADMSLASASPGAFLYHPGLERSWFTYCPSTCSSR